jgi:hypothetical protein
MSNWGILRRLPHGCCVVENKGHAGHVSMGQSCMTRLALLPWSQLNGRFEIKIIWLCLTDDVASLHVKIDNLNSLLVGFCFIKSID